MIIQYSSRTSLQIQYYKHSRVTLPLLNPQPSRLIVNKSSLARAIRQYSSRTLLQARRYRYLRATLSTSPLQPSHLIVSKSSLVRAIRQCGSRTLLQVRRYRRSNITLPLSPLQPFHPIIIYYLLYVYLIIKQQKVKRIFSSYLPITNLFIKLFGIKLLFQDIYQGNFYFFSLDKG